MTFSTPSFEKPFINYEAMIDLMQSSNIDVGDREAAVSALQEFSYYVLINGYKDTFLAIPGTDCFVPGTKFDDILTIHLIDININGAILKYILSIENSLKSKLAYLIAEKYGVWTDRTSLQLNNDHDYLSISHYTKNRTLKNIAKNLMKRLKYNLNQQCRHNKTVKSKALLHYIDHHTHIPPWILMTEITFGDAISWYSVLKSEDKREICNLLISSAIKTEDKEEFLKQALELLRKFRNKIAHNNRTFNVSNLPVLPKWSYLALTCGTLTEEEYDNNMGKSDLYGVLNTCLLLFGTPYLGSQLINDIKYIFEPYTGQSIMGKSILSIFGLPNDIIERLETIQKSKFPQ